MTHSEYEKDVDLITKYVYVVCKYIKVKRVPKVTNSDVSPLTPDYSNCRGLCSYYCNHPFECDFTYRYGMIGFLKEKSGDISAVLELEDELLFYAGEEWCGQRNSLALKYLGMTNIQNHPIAAVLSLVLHLNKSNYENDAEKIICSDIKKIKNVIDSDKWETNSQKAMAYYWLGLAHCTPGVYPLQMNIGYAQYCFRMAARLDSSWDRPRKELKKMSQCDFSNNIYDGAYNSWYYADEIFSKIIE